MKQEQNPLNRTDSDCRTRSFWASALVIRLDLLMLAAERSELVPANPILSLSYLCQASAQLTKKSADLKALQRRADIAKTEAEQAKAQTKTLKALVAEVGPRLREKVGRGFRTLM